MDKAKVFVITSWDDFTEQDFKMCELLEKYKLKGTFFVVNNWVSKDISRERLKHISEYHEIGAHTLDHTVLTGVSDDEARRQISVSKSLLEETLGRPVVSFAYPKGCYKMKHAIMVQEANYICARTTRPFYTTHYKNSYEINVTLWAYPHEFKDIAGLLRLFRDSPRTILNPLLIKDWNRLGKLLFDTILESGGVFHIFGHSWQLDEKNGWSKLEDLLAHLAFRKNVRYLTMADYVKSRIAGII
jgi:peptidoglycan/xylan/chitin deacetylase (PgdA/CDA1 family)